MATTHGVDSMTILVTGAGGLVGSALGRATETLGMDRRTLDITDVDAIQRAFDTHRPIAVINAAAQAGVDRADEQPEYTRLVNATAVGHLAAACAQHGVRLVHLSTDYVLDNPNVDRLKESEEPNPRSVYAQTKWEGEQLALSQDATVVRLQWVYQPGTRGFFNHALREMRSGRPIRLVTDQVGCPTPATLLTPILIKMAQSGPTGLFHLATQGEATAWEWIEASATAMGVPFHAIKAKRQDFGGAHRPERSCLDSTKIAQQWGIELPEWERALHTVAQSSDRIKTGKDL